MGSETTPHKPKPLIGDCWTITFESVSQRAILNPNNVWTWGGVTGSTDTLIAHIEGLGGSIEFHTIYNTDGLEVSDVKNVEICVPCDQFKLPPSDTLDWSFFLGSRTSVWEKKECPVKPCPTQLNPYCVEARILCVMRDNGLTAGSSTGNSRPDFIYWDQIFGSSSLSLNGQDCDTGQLGPYANPTAHLQAWTDARNQAFAGKGIDDKYVAARARLGRPTFWFSQTKTVDPNAVFGDWKLSDPGSGPRDAEGDVLVHPVVSDETIVTGWYYFTHDGCDENGNFQDKTIHWCEPDPDNAGGFIPANPPTWNPTGEEEVPIPFECFKPCGYNFGDPIAEDAGSECETGDATNVCEWSPAVIDEDGQVVAPAAKVTEGVFLFFSFCPDGVKAFGYTIDANDDYVPHDLGEGNYYGDCETGEEVEPPAGKCPEGAQFLPNETQKVATFVDNSNWTGLTQLHYNNAIGGDIRVELADGSFHIEPYVAGVSSFLQMRAAMLNAGACLVGVASFNHPNGSADNAMNVPAYANQSPPPEEMFATGWVTEWCATNRMTKISIDSVTVGDQANVGAFRPLQYYDGPIEKIYMAVTCDGPFFKDCNFVDIPAPSCKPRPCGTSCQESIKSLLECKVCPKIQEGGITLTEDGSPISYPFTVTNDFADHTTPLTISDPTGCLAENPDAVIGVEIAIDHEAGPFDAHRAFFLIASAGVFTQQSASNTAGVVGNSNIMIGYSVGEAGNQRNIRTVKLEATAAQWLAGISLSTGFFGGVGGATETIHSRTLKICSGLEICDGC